MHNIRLASILSFDENSEADIISMIEQLNSKHKMGEFITSLFRLAVDNPDLLVKNASTGVVTEGIIVREVERLGKTKVRAQYIKDIQDDVRELEKKIDFIYNMCTQLKSAFEFGKRNSLEASTENALMTTFLLERQLKELKRKVYDSSLSIEMNKIVNDKQKFEETVESTLEFILKSYEPIVTELLRSANSVRENTVQEVKVTIEQPVYTSPVMNSSPVQSSNFIKSDNLVQSDNSLQSSSVKNDTTKELDIEPTEFILDTDDEAPVDFSEADFGALANFFDA